MENKLLTTKEITLDCETTTANSGNPFSRGNRLCTVGYLVDGIYSDCCVEYSSVPYGTCINKLQQVVEEAALLILFNAKFDLAWLLNYIPKLKIPPIWDCQVAEYSLSGQEHMWPSLNESLERRGLPLKLDEVGKLWKAGYDTPDIPLDVLLPYQKQDVVSTHQLYLRQKEEFERHPTLKRMFDYLMDDTKVLLEMERNGILLSEKQCQAKIEECQMKAADLVISLEPYTDQHIVNWNSPNQVSVFFYGTRGLSPDPNTESADTKGKSDDEIAAINTAREQEKPKKKPIYRTYSVDEASLLRQRSKVSKVDKHIIDKYLEYKKLAKLLKTYYVGLTELIKEYNWEPGVLHGTFNQCSTRTGRLSSSKPNMQNFAGEIKDIFTSRYNDEP